MELPLTGGCQCGKLRYQITEAPRLVYSCHCTKCQKITSSAFSMGFVVTEEAFRLTAGEPHLAQSTGDSGRACLLGGCAAIAARGSLEVQDWVGCCAQCAPARWTTPHG